MTIFTTSRTAGWLSAADCSVDAFTSLLSQRTDSNFWVDNRDPASIPESLKEQLELWRQNSGRAGPE